LIIAANDPHLTAFDELMPALEGAYQEVADLDDRTLASVRQMLLRWDGNYGVNSVETTLAVYWAEKLRETARSQTDKATFRSMLPDEWMIQNTSPQEKIDALKIAIQNLETDFGNWQIPWGVINRFQRLSPDIEQEFNDERPSIPVGFTSAWWGSLASFGTISPPNCNKRYGTAGNSFVAVVSFGKRLQARAVVSGGQSGQKSSPHFNDQQKLYAQGAFRDVHFYREEVEANAEKTYHPGE
jgi:acyl-homoserine lactone acylase PvdQ